MILSTPTQHTSNIAVQISQLGHYDINSVREKKSNISQYFRSSTEGLVVCVLVIQVWLKELCWWSVISCCGWPVCEKRLPELSWLSWADALLIIVIILNQSHSASDHREREDSRIRVFILRFIVICQIIFGSELSFTLHLLRQLPDALYELSLSDGHGNVKNTLWHPSLAIIN